MSAAAKNFIFHTPQAYNAHNIIGDAHYSAVMVNLADIDTETLGAAHAFMEAVAGRYDMIGAILFGSRA